MLWGIVLSIGDSSFRVMDIDPFGQPDEEDELEFAQILYFDFDEEYSQRLLLLKDFQPTFPTEVSNVTNSFEISNLLNEAAKTGEPIRLSYPGTERMTATVGQVGTGWVEVTTYDDLMKQESERWIKIALISEVSWRSAMCEADAYLMG